MYKFNFYHTRPENFFRNDKAEQTKGLVGYLRGDFGKDGKEFHHTWFNNNEKLNNRVIGCKSDKEYINENLEVLDRFTDVKSDTHWAFYDIISASNDHMATSLTNSENWID